MSLSPDQVRTHVKALHEFIECVESSKLRLTKLQHFHCMMQYLQEYRVLENAEFSKFKGQVEEKLREVYSDNTEAKWIPEIYRDFFKVEMPVKNEKVCRLVGSSETNV